MSRTPVTTPSAEETLAVRFDQLAAAWQEAVAHHSSNRQRENHPLYQAIIALGPNVVPLLLRDLETHHRHWFTALAAMTGENPIRPEHVGDIARMAEDWLRWGKAKGYQW